MLIAGTGSVAFGRNAAGETARAGGYGPWIGDEGSAFEIGRRAVSAVARARDADAPVTLLAEMISAAIECPDWDELMLRIMKNPDDVFPKLFPVVADAANAEDNAAKEILFASAIGLGNLAMIVIRRLGMKDKQFPLVKCGGVFGHSQMLDSLLDSVLASGALRAKISRLEISPAVGAARMAARLSEFAAASCFTWRLKIAPIRRPRARRLVEEIPALLAAGSEEVLRSLIDNPAFDETHVCLLLERKDLSGLAARRNQQAQTLARELSRAACASRRIRTRRA